MGFIYKVSQRQRGTFGKKEDQYPVHPPYIQKALCESYLHPYSKPKDEGKIEIIIQQSTDQNGKSTKAMAGHTATLINC